jgi:hypothetical protein
MSPAELERKKNTCADFMDEVIYLAKKRNISPDLTIRLFGMIGRYVADGRIAEGGDPDNEIDTVLRLFTRGLTVQDDPDIANYIPH